MTRTLFVDLTSGTAQAEDLEVLGLSGLGGKALAIELLERYLDPTVDPLAPSNVVVLTPSPVAAYGFSGSNRFGAFTKSPMTGAFLESYAGGTMARTLRETGWDAVVLRGSAGAPRRVHVDQDGASVLPADDLWGMDVFDTEDALRATLAKRSSTMIIGPAGETLSALASVMLEKDHALGRGGLGAVFGSKGIKAITVTSPGSLRLEAGEAFETVRRAVSKLATDSPAAGAYRSFGTPMMVAVLNEAGAFPTGYWESGRAAHRADLEAENYPTWAKVETGTCPPCPIRCRRHLTILDGPHAGREVHGPEYESLYSFGGLCGVRYAQEVLLLHEECNRLGMDTMSGGNLISLAMKAAETGRLSAGEAPAPGDVPAISELLAHMAHRDTELGDTLSRGIRGAAAALGMSDQAIHVKGMEPAGYDPRSLRGMALAYATSPRGACHLRATFYKPILAGMVKDKDARGTAEVFVDFEDRLFLYDCLIMCRFYRDFLSWDDLAVVVSEFAGAPVDTATLQTLAGDLLTRVRRLNFAMGLTAADDTLPKRFFTEGLDDKPPIGERELGDWLDAYFELRDWPAGAPPSV
ncbi:MAG: aldehyde ferredoxin oxidoreductase family protein [Thermoleophilia bacterium]